MKNMKKSVEKTNDENTYLVNLVNMVNYEKFVS